MFEHSQRQYGKDTRREKDESSGSGNQRGHSHEVGHGPTMPSMAPGEI